MVRLDMDVLELIREEWDSLLGALVGVAAAGYAASTGQWLWFIISGTLALASLRILQSEGWIASQS